MSFIQFSFLLQEENELADDELDENDQSSDDDSGYKNSEAATTETFDSTQSPIIANIVPHNIDDDEDAHLNSIVRRAAQTICNIPNRDSESDSDSDPNYKRAFEKGWKDFARRYAKK